MYAYMYGFQSSDACEHARGCMRTVLLTYVRFTQNTFVTVYTDTFVTVYTDTFVTVYTDTFVTVHTDKFTQTRL
jgi:hypothetical protein